MEYVRAVKVVDVQAKVVGDKIIIGLYKMYPKTSNISDVPSLESIESLSDSGYFIGKSNIEIQFTEDSDKLCMILASREAIDDIVAIINAARQPNMLKVY